MKYFPLFVDLKQQSVLVVGAGVAACRKISLLQDAGADITVVAPEAEEEIINLAEQGKLTYRCEFFSDALLDQQKMVISATHDKALNQQVHDAAGRLNVLCNSVDDPANSDFIVPSMVDRGDIQIAVSSAGVSPVLARKIRLQIENLLPQSLGALASLFSRWRSRVMTQLSDAGQRRYFWEQSLSGGVPEAVEQGDDVKAEQLLATLLASVPDRSADISEAPVGHVSLVGAGPGDVELLTVKAQQRLQTADIIFYDALVGEHVLSRARRDAERVYVGKKAGLHSTSQQSIQEQMIAAAKQGLRVVRLKGGDPFIFGRGGEELDALIEAGINFDVVPGITAAAAAAAYTGISLTHRQWAQSVVLVTGHLQEKSELDWQALAKSKQTLAIYMGLQQVTSIQQQLLHHGRAGETPVVIIEAATRPQQRVIGSCLAELSDAVERQQVKSPAMILVGEVCEQLGRYHWFGSAPVVSKD